MDRLLLKDGDRDNLSNELCAVLHGTDVMGTPQRAGGIICSLLPNFQVAGDPLDIER
jgi:hypothetical protein